jgi:hypothetical protein
MLCRFLVNVFSIKMSSAALMLNEQHMPWSVGKVVKMAAHETGVPFHSQYVRSELPLSPLAAVTFCMSKHGREAYQSVAKTDSKAADLFILRSISFSTAPVRPTDSFTGNLFWDMVHFLSIVFFITSVFHPNFITFFNNC